MDGGAWWAAVHGVAKGRTQLSNFSFPFHFHALEKEMATHSGDLAWRIPGMGEPGGLPSTGQHRVGHNGSDLAAASAAADAPQVNYSGGLNLIWGHHIKSFELIKSLYGVVAKGSTCPPVCCHEILSIIFLPLIDVCFLCDLEMCVQLLILNKGPFHHTPTYTHTHTPE